MSRVCALSFSSLGHDLCERFETEPGCLETLREHGDEPAAPLLQDVSPFSKVSMVRSGPSGRKGSSPRWSNTWMIGVRGGTDHQRWIMSEWAASGETNAIARRANKVFTPSKKAEIPLVDSKKRTGESARADGLDPVSRSGIVSNRPCRHSRNQTCPPVFRRCGRRSE